MNLVRYVMIVLVGCLGLSFTANAQVPAIDLAELSACVPGCDTANPLRGPKAREVKKFLAEKRNCEDAKWLNHASGFQNCVCQPAAGFELYDFVRGDNGAREVVWSQVAEATRQARADAKAWRDQVGSAPHPTENGGPLAALVDKLKHLADENEEVDRRQGAAQVKLEERAIALEKDVGQPATATSPATGMHAVNDDQYRLIDRLEDPLGLRVGYFLQTGAPLRYGLEDGATATARSALGQGLSLEVALLPNPDGFHPNVTLGGAATWDQFSNDGEEFAYQFSPVVWVGLQGTYTEGDLEAGPYAEVYARLSGLYTGYDPRVTAHGGVAGVFVAHGRGFLKLGGGSEAFTDGNSLYHGGVFRFQAGVRL